MSELKKPLVVYLPDTRGVTVSRYGRGNLKIGAGVYTYSRLPGLPSQSALGTHQEGEVTRTWNGTCPGASEECRAICYARRPVQEMGVVSQMWLVNSIYGTEVPTIPEDATLLRLHVSGDFDTVEYIEGWIARLTLRPDVVCWAYTRSWRVPALLDALERLRALPNVQLFASMDQSIPELPPDGWRRAWIDGDPRAGKTIDITAHGDVGRQLIGNTYDGTSTYVCPEETRHKENCVDCGYCFRGQKNDVTFLRH
jgi:hypothetical protein